MYRLAVLPLTELPKPRFDAQLPRKYYILRNVMEYHGIRDYGQGPSDDSKAVREHLRLKPGDRIKFFVRPDGSVVLLPKLHASALRDIVKPRRRPVSIEEMTAAAAAGAAEGARRARRR